MTRVEIISGDQSKVERDLAFIVNQRGDLRFVSFTRTDGVFHALVVYESKRVRVPRGSGVA